MLIGQARVREVPLMVDSVVRKLLGLKKPILILNLLVLWTAHVRRPASAYSLMMAISADLLQWLSRRDGLESCSSILIQSTIAVSGCNSC